MHINRICGVMVSVLASGAVDPGFELRLGRTNDNELGICCSSEIRFVLDQRAEYDFYIASSLKQQSAGRHVVPHGHIILIPSQPVFALSQHSINIKRC
jgi:hypothetical protein